LIFGGSGSDEDPGPISAFSSPIGVQSLAGTACWLALHTRTLSYSYDRLHRLTAASYPAAGVGQPARSYAYTYGCNSVSRGETLKFGETS
jgi:hypothetical protein